MKEVTFVLAGMLLFAPAAIRAQTDPEIPEKITLQQARSVLQNSPLLVAKRQEVNVEKGDVLDAGKYSNPTLSLGTEGIVFASDRGTFLDRLQPSVTLRQEFVTAGKREKRKRVEVADAEISSMEIDNLHRQLRFDLARLYYSVVRAQRDLEVAREILGQFREVIELNRIRLEAGEISGAELRRTEAAEYSFFADLVDAEVRLENAKSELLALLGANDLNHSFEAVDDLDPSFAPPPQAELERLALRERPDLAAERARVRRSGLTLELEEAESKPNVTAFSGYKRELDSNGPVVGIDLPLFLFNRNEGPIQKARAGKRRQENRLLYNQALYDFEISRARLEAATGGDL